MSNDLTLIEQAKLPVALAAMFGNSANDLTANVGGGFTYLSIRGKVWTVVRGKDDRQVVTNEDGDPRSSIEVVVVKANSNLSKVFYAKKYVDGSDAKPDCYSNDGVAPAADATAPQAKQCMTCPQNQWGSRITEDGKKAKACSDSRRLAVAPLSDLRDVMLVRVPATSLANLKEYGDKFARKNIPYQLAVTKMRFDPESASQKLMFECVGFLNAEQAAVVKEMTESDVVQQIIGTTLAQEFEDNGTAPAVAAPAPAPAPAPAKPAPAVAQFPKAKAKPAAAVTAADIPDVAIPGKVEAAAPKAKGPAKVSDSEDLMNALDSVLDDADD